MHLRPLFILACLMGTAAACGQTDNVVAGSSNSSGSERYLLFANANSTRTGSCGDPNIQYTEATVGTTFTEILGQIYQSNDNGYLLDTTQTYYTTVVPALPVLAGTKSIGGYTFTGTTATTETPPLQSASQAVVTDTLTYTFTLTAGKNADFDRMTGTLDMQDTQTCAGSDCADTYLRDCTTTVTFSAIHLTNVATVVQP